MKRLVAAIALLISVVFPASGQHVHLLVRTNGALAEPIDFFVINSNLIVAAIGGAFSGGGGGGSGNASTNVAQGWSASQTFGGPVLFGTTNAVTELALKAPLASPPLTGNPAVNGTNLMAAVNDKEPLNANKYQSTNSTLTAHAQGNLSGGTNLNASTAFSSGTVPIARIATGTPDGTKFVRDDGTLATPSGGGLGDVVGPASSTDSVVALYNGTTGKLLKNGTLTESAISANLTEAEASVLYQQTNAVLTQLKTLNGSGLTNLSATTAFSSGTVPIARMASGTPDGTKFIRDDGTLATPAGGGSGNASTNVAQGWSADQTFTNVTVTGSFTAGDMTVNSITSATPFPIISGGTGATNASQARTNLGLIIGGDVQAYSARLSDIAGISYSTGDIIYYDGANLARRAIGTNGQVLTVSGGVPTWATATGGSGGGTTNLSGLTGDVALGALSDGQYLGYNSTSSKWTNRTPATNPLLVNWIGAYGIGTRTNFAASTNVLIASFSVPPTADPGINGRYIIGNASMLLTNDTAVSDSYDFRIVAAGVTVVDATKVVSTALFENYTFNFRVVRESDTSASIYADGVGIISSSTANIGVGSFGGQVRDFISVATNVAWTWANTNALEIYVGLRNTGAGATTFGVTRLGAGLYSLVDNAAIISDTAFASSYNGVTNIAPSKNAFYDYAHITDTDDDGFPNVLDTGATGVTASASSSNTVVATTAYVDRAVASGTGSAANIPPLHDDFIFYDPNTGYAQFPWNNQNNAGGTVTLGASETNAPGVLDFAITTSGSSRATLEARGTDALMLGDGIEWNMEFRTKVSALSDGTDTYIIRAGFLDTRPDVDSTDCVGIRYTHGVNSGKYEFVCRSNSTETTSDSGLTPSTTSFQTFRIRVDSTAANAYLYTNGVLAATITSANIPKGAARAVSPGMFGITRTSGTSNARTMKMDYYDLRGTGVVR